MDILAGVLAGALVVVPFQNAAQNPISPGGGVSLVVHVYNLADVHTKNLERALRETARILAVAGIEIVFEPGSADSPEAHTSDMNQWLPSMWQKPDGDPPKDAGILIAFRSKRRACDGVLRSRRKG